MPIPDERLMTSWRDGDEDAFAELYSRHSRPVMAYIARLVYDRQLAEDCFQETFYRVFAYARSYDPTRPFRPWLFRIATNVCRSAPRASLPLADTPDARGNQGEAVAGGSAEDSCDVAAEVRAALLALTIDQRAVIVLHHYHGLSYPEMAAALDVPLGTVKSRMNAALGAMRRQLGPMPDMPYSKEAAR